MGLVYRSANTNIQNAMKAVSKGDCIIMEDFNNGHIQWKYLENTMFNSG